MRIKVSSRRVPPAECEAIGKQFGAEEGVERVAAVQHAMVNHAQLLALGLRRTAVQRRVVRGRLKPIHRGVYLVGPVVPPLGEEMAAILACRGEAWISHASATFLHELPPYPAKPHPVALTVIGSAVRHPKLRVHRAGRLERDEVTEVEGIPVTTAPRALIDVAAVFTPARFEQTIAAGYAAGLASREDLLRLADRYPHRPGGRLIRDLLDARPALTRSRDERSLLGMIRKAGLPEPATNERIGKWEVDFLWAGPRLIVELDTLATHTSPFHFERDRRKDAELTLAGYTVIRVTRRQLEEDPEAVIATLSTALAHLGPYSGAK